MSSETTGSTWLYDALAWLEVNKQRLALAFIAALVVGVIAAYLRWSSHQTELKANEALLQLRTRTGENQSQPSAQSFSKIVADFPSTDAAERASLLAAGALFTEGNYAEAQAQFDRFVQQHPDHPLASTAAFGRAASMEAQGKQDEALTAYQSLLTQYSRAAMADRTKLAIARIYEAKKQPELALKQYEELIDPQNTTASSAEAMTRKEHLLKEHPQLAKPVAPPASTNATPAAVTNIIAPAAATNR